MGKTTKRQRKFLAANNAKTQKNKRTKGPPKSKPAETAEKPPNQAPTKNLPEDDISNETNVAHLDVASFFNMAMDADVDLDDDDDKDSPGAESDKESAALDADEDESPPNDDDNDDELDDFEDDESENEAEEPESASQGAEHDSSETMVLNASLLEKMSKQSFDNNNIETLRQLVATLKAACVTKDGDDKREGGPFSVESPSVFSDLAVVVFTRCGEVLSPMFQPPQDAKGPSPSKKEAKQILMLLMKASISLLKETRDAKLVSFVLQHLEKYLSFMSQLPKLALPFLKAVVQLWSSSTTSQKVKLNAFLRIRQLAISQPFPFVETVLKKTYLAYVETSRAASKSIASLANGMKALTFMGNCLCDLYNIDHLSSYQHAFVYIRQLALLLRAYTVSKSTESAQEVYSWQYLNCLKLWTVVIVDAVAKDPDTKLGSLLHPLVECIIGMVRHCPSPVRYLPLRFHCVRLLHRLTASFQVFVPSAGLLLDALDYKEWSQSSKREGKGTSSSTALNQSLLLKFPSKQDALRLQADRDFASKQLFLLLNHDMELYRYTPAFPEYSSMILSKLRRFVKHAASQGRHRTLAKACIEKCSQYVATALRLRNASSYTPASAEIFECLKPASADTMLTRYEALRKQELQFTAQIHSDAVAESNRLQEEGGPDDDEKMDSYDAKDLEMEDEVEELNFDDED